MNRFLLTCCVLVLSLGASSHASKLRLTGGVTSLDGAAGGGLSPWALIGSPSSQGEWGAAAALTRVHTADYRLQVASALLAFDDRIELSLARQRLDTGTALAPIGLPGVRLEQDIVGLKLRVAGEAVLDADRWQPQIAAGWFYKRAGSNALSPTLTGPLGARQAGHEFYLAATKLWLDSGVLANLTLRATRANQNGLLGHGGAQDRRWHLLPELSVAKLLSPQLALGLELRAKPDALRQSVLGDGALRERDWFDAFVAWAPTPQASLTLAWVELGAIAPAAQARKQRGPYLSVQIGL